LTFWRLFIRRGGNRFGFWFLRFSRIGFFGFEIFWANSKTKPNQFRSKLDQTENQIQNRFGSFCKPWKPYIKKILNVVIIQTLIAKFQT